MCYLKRIYRPLPLFRENTVRHVHLHQYMFIGFVARFLSFCCFKASRTIVWCVFVLEKTKLKCKNHFDIEILCVN